MKLKINIKVYMIVMIIGIPLVLLDVRVLAKLAKVPIVEQIALILAIILYAKMLIDVIKDNDKSYINKLLTKKEDIFNMYAFYRYSAKIDKVFKKNMRAFSKKVRKNNKNRGVKYIEHITEDVNNILSKLGESKSIPLEEFTIIKKLAKCKGTSELDIINYGNQLYYANTIILKYHKINIFHRPIYKNILSIADIVFIVLTGICFACFR